MLVSGLELSATYLKLSWVLKRVLVDALYCRLHNITVFFFYYWLVLLLSLHFIAVHNVLHVMFLGCLFFDLIRDVAIFYNKAVTLGLIWATVWETRLVRKTVLVLLLLLQKLPLLRIHLLKINFKLNKCRPHNSTRLLACWSKTCPQTTNSTILKWMWRPQ